MHDPGPLFATEDGITSSDILHANIEHGIVQSSAHQELQREILRMSAVVMHMHTPEANIQYTRLESAVV